MFLPLYDLAPLRRLKAPHVTRVIMVLCSLVWLAAWAGIGGGVEFLVLEAGVIPAVLWGRAILPPGLDAVPPVVTLVTSAFLHGSAIHLIGNMLFLQVFGDNVEDAMGHGRFTAFYVACAAAGGLAHAVAAPASQQPLIGASGAVAGIVGAYLVLHPRVRVWGLMLNIVPVRLNAAWILGAWLAFQIYHALAGDERTTGWWAHLGGFAAGIMLLPLLRVRPGPAVSMP